MPQKLRKNIPLKSWINTNKFAFFSSKVKKKGG